MKPKPIGNRVGLIAPASPSKNNKEAILALEKMGFEVVASKGLSKKVGFFAGDDKYRANELKSFLSRNDISAVFCVRGGYGSARLLPLLKKHRSSKLFIGFSDITALQAQRNICGSIHSSIFLNNREVRILKELMSSTKPYGDLLESKKSLEVGRGGTAKGKIFSANLSILTSLLGTPYFPDLRGVILCLEDVNEAPYRVDRMLTQLILSGVLDSVKGFCFGDFGKGDFNSIFLERLYSFRRPILLGLPFGHGKRRLPIPQWIEGKLNTKEKELVLIESVVR